MRAITAPVMLLFLLPAIAVAATTGSYDQNLGGWIKTPLSTTTDADHWTIDPCEVPGEVLCPDRTACAPADATCCPDSRYFCLKGMVCRGGAPDTDHVSDRCCDPSNPEDYFCQAFLGPVTIEMDDRADHHKNQNVVDIARRKGGGRGGGGGGGSKGGVTGAVAQSGGTGGGGQAAPAAGGAAVGGGVAIAGQPKPMVVPGKAYNRTSNDAGSHTVPIQERGGPLAVVVAALVFLRILQ